jgi:DNA topoisomerase-2
MYVGSTKLLKSDLWTYDSINDSMVLKTLEFPPALIKIFDEILVNAADNKQRDKNTSYIDVHVNPTEEGLEVSIENDGKSIPIQMHEKENIYVPELVFGHLLTGSNFDDKKARLTGGSHGYGAKLTNIFSKYFAVEVVDTKRGLQYHQQWNNNMTDMSKPNVRPVTKRQTHDYTKITFRPALSEFGYSDDANASLTDTGEGDMAKLSDIIDLYKRRTLDVAACVPSVKVSFNKKRLSINSFEDYVKLFRDVRQFSDDAVDNAGQLIESDATRNQGPVFYTRVNDRWSVGVRKSPTTGFENMSFVNNVWTPAGGTHVEHVANQVVSAIEDAITSKKRKIRPSIIRNKLMVFVDSKIENPSFLGQSKDILATPQSQFGSNCRLTQKFLTQVIKGSGIVEDIMFDLKLREDAKLLDASKNKKGKQNVVDVPKLQDAHLAGTSRGTECTLILTEVRVDIR